MMRFSVKEFREKLKARRFRRVLSRQIEDILGRVDTLPTLDIQTKFSVTTSTGCRTDRSLV